MKSAYGLPKKREEVVKVLQKAYTEGNLEELEYENRLEAVYEAKSMEALKEVVSDFPAPIKAGLFPSRTAPTAPSSSQPTTTSPSLPTQPIRSLLSEQHYSIQHLGETPLTLSNFLGSQEVDAKMAVIESDSIRMYAECVLGSTVIDLRNPQFRGKHIDLFVNGALGEVKIKIPPNVQVSRPLRLIASEFSFKKKSTDFMSLFKKGKQAEPELETLFSLTIHGSFILGSVLVLIR